MGASKKVQNVNSDEPFTNVHGSNSDNDNLQEYQEFNIAVGR